MEITVQELHQKLQAGDDIVFIDVREPWEYEAFNLGATLIPVGDIMNRMWELEDYKTAEIVVHCRSGARSGMAQSILLANGFEHVSNVQGGIMAWQEAYGNEKP